MITIKKIEGAFKTSYTLIDDSTGLNVGLTKGKNWLIKRQAWNLCNNKDYLTNHKNTGHYNKITKCWFFANDIENFMDEANKNIEIETTLFGINSTNLVNPSVPAAPELKQLDFVPFFDRQQVILPEPLVIEADQRPFVVPGQK